MSDGGSASCSSSDTAAGYQLFILYRFIRILFQILVRISLVGVDANRMVKVMIHEIDCENGTFVVVHDMNGDVVDEEESTTEASVEGAQEEEDVCVGVGDEPAGKRKRVIHKKPLINYYKSRQTLVMFRRDIRLSYPARHISRAS